MTKFEAVFGISSNQIKKFCILMPLLPKGILKEFGIKALSKGRLYSSGNSGTFTIICTGVGAGFVGDAVLYLKETGCENVILFGSCGLVNKDSVLSVGSLVSPVKCYASESFSEMLLNRDKGHELFHPDKDLLGRLIETGKNDNLSRVTCATLSSLKLEEEMTDFFMAKGIDVVDMECSAFFSAAGYTGIRAASLFFVSDVINHKPFYMDLEPDLKSKFYSALKISAKLLCAFTGKNSNA